MGTRYPLLIVFLPATKNSINLEVKRDNTHTQEMWCVQIIEAHPSSTGDIKFFPLLCWKNSSPTFKNDHSEVPTIVGEASAMSHEHSDENSDQEVEELNIGARVALLDKCLKQTEEQRVKWRQKPEIGKEDQISENQDAT